MKPVFQVPMDGECLRACLASVLELPFEVVPSANCPGHKYDEVEKNFHCFIPEHKEVSSGGYISYSCDGGHLQKKRIRDFVSQFGLQYQDIRMKNYGNKVGTQNDEPLPPGICIASGPSPRGSFHHVVVWDTRLTDFEHPYGRMIHDPTPDPENKHPGVGDIDEFTFFTVVDPGKLKYLAEYSAKHSEEKNDASN